MDKRKRKIKMKKYKCSFDFDGTLEILIIQEYAKELIEREIEVWIITSRYNVENYAKNYKMDPEYAYLANRDLFEVAEKLQIPEERIHFTNMRDKWEFIENRGFLWHLDDDWIENEMINSRTLTKGIDLFDNETWKKQCDSEIKRAFN
jgi:hypothetical protein